VGCGLGAQLPPLAARITEWGSEQERASVGSPLQAAFRTVWLAVVLPPGWPVEKVVKPVNSSPAPISNGQQVTRSGPPISPGLAVHRGLDTACNQAQWGPVEPIPPMAWLPAGRPVDVLQLKDGSLLISDDTAGMVYRVVYRG
jgi:hypothetical protein